MRKELEDRLKQIYDKFKTIKLEELEKDNSFIDIKSYKVTINDGSVFYRDKIVKNKGYGSSSSVLPVLSNNNVILVVEPRVFTKRTVEIALPGGYIDEGETKFDAVKRELEEETGLLSNDIREVAEFYSDLGNSEHINTIYIAFDCEKNGNVRYDSDEFVEMIEVSIDELYELIDKGYIKSATTVVAAAKLKEILEKKVI